MSCLLLGRARQLILKDIVQLSNVEGAFCLILILEVLCA